jgi:muramoyltetrapeptide carboxypeptidase
MDAIRPKRLLPHDVIGLISPASRIADTARIERGVRYLEGLGYRVRVGENVTRQHGYLAGTDDERLADLHSMFEDPQVRAIFCIRGGYGSPRLLPNIRYRTIARSPKIFVGYSDITALHLALWRKTGLITFHGPMLGVDLADPMDPFSEEMLWRLLTSPRRFGPISFPAPQPRSISPGRAVGRLLGGNLALVASLIGTGFQPRFRDSLLFLEDIGEDPYRIDRMMTQLRGAGLLRGARALLLGQFTECVPRDGSVPSFSVDEVLHEYASSSGLPALAGVPFGHERVKMTIPVGALARVDTERGVIEIAEAAVR